MLAPAQTVALCQVFSGLLYSSPPCTTLPQGPPYTPALHHTLQIAAKFSPANWVCSGAWPGSMGRSTDLAWDTFLPNTQPLQGPVVRAGLLRNIYAATKLLQVTKGLIKVQQVTKAYCRSIQLSTGNNRFLKIATSIYYRRSVCLSVTKF